MSKATATTSISPEIYVDSVIFQLIDNELAVVLTQRTIEPYKGMWALPGGRNPVRETTHKAMEHYLETKTGLKVDQLGFVEQLYTFDTASRDENKYAVSVIYLGLGKNLTPKITKPEKPAQFFPLARVPQLAFDHNEIIEYAHQRLIAKLSYTNAVFALLPRLFTLSQLQMAYEAVLGRKLDKRNFRKKFLGLDLINASNEYHMDGAHRPARLYKFKTGELEYLSRSFD